MAKFYHWGDVPLVDPFGMRVKQGKEFVSIGNHFPLPHPPVDEIKVLDEHLVIILPLGQDPLLQQGEGLGPKSQQPGKKFLLQRVGFLQIGRDRCVEPLALLGAPTMGDCLTGSKEVLQLLPPQGGLAPARVLHVLRQTREQDQTFPTGYPTADSNPWGNGRWFPARRCHF